MKTLVLSMISIAATVAAMTACTSESDEIDEIEAKVPIELNAGVLEITSKAVVNQGDQFDAQVMASETSKTYTTPFWTEAGAGNISVASDGKVTFDPIQYYPTNGNTIYMIGYSPRATTSNGKVAYTIQGDNDIMVSNEISGSRTSKDPTGKELSFTHLLTQLQIKVVAANADAIAAWGGIKSIEVVDASTSVELDLGTGKLIEAGSPTVGNVPVDYTFTPALVLPNLTATPTPEQAKSAGSVMVLPRDTKYQLLIKTENNQTGITIDPSVVKTEASKAYEITLTFKSANVDVTASAGKWESVTGGTGTVE